MADINPKARTIWAIHAAFMLAVPMYAVVTHFVLLQNPENIHANPFIARILLIVAIVQIPLGFILGEVVAKTGMRMNTAAGPKYLDPITSKIIMGDALFEAIAVYGVVGAIFGMPAWQSDLLFVISFVLLTIQAIRIRNQFD